MIVAGFGFRSDATLSSLLDAFEKAGGRHATHLATASSKAREKCFRDLAALIKLPVVLVPETGLAGQNVETQSEASLTAYGTGSVSEAAALAAAGEAAKLKDARVVSNDKMATCAIAEGRT